MKSLLRMESVPLIVPVVLGVNVRLMVQDVPGASEVPQVLVWANPALVVKVPIASDDGAALESVIVRVLGALVLPTAVVGNFTAVGE